MKLRKKQAKYISKKITKDLMNCEFVEIRKDNLAISTEVENILNADIDKELALEEHVNEMLAVNEDDIEFYNVDTRQLFWMTKKRIANEFGVILNYEDRYNDIAHQMLDYLWEEDFIHFTVSDNKIKNVIFNSISEFLKGFDEADTLAYEKIKNYQRKLIPGTEDYEAIFSRLYEEELMKRGLI